MEIFESGIVDVKLGVGVKIGKPSNIYQCTLQDEVFVGPFCEIQSGVMIGKKTRIQSHSFICSCVTIGECCFIGHGVMFINDLFQNGRPAGGDQSKWKTTTIGNNVNIGSNCTILPVSICDDVTIGAGSVVTRDIKQAGIYFGNPAKRSTNG